jgi:hypothetical protein
MYDKDLVLQQVHAKMGSRTFAESHNSRRNRNSLPSIQKRKSQASLQLHNR